jgi:topoisomerase-4 subunit A
VTDEPVTVIISQKGWLRTRPGHAHDSAQWSFKAGDTLYGAFECRSIDPLLVFGSNGRVYSIPVSALPGARGDGVPVTSLIDLASGSQILHYFAGDSATLLLLASHDGMGFTASIGDMTGRMKAGKAFVNFDSDGALLPPCPITDTSSAIACLSEQGRLLVFGLAEIKHLASGGKGVILMELENNEKLRTAQVISQKGVTVIGIGRGGKPQEVSLSTTQLAPHINKRARKGKALESKIKAQGLRPNS